MKQPNKEPEIVMRNCSYCGRPVKCVLIEKGTWYDHYICLENQKAKKFHVFKVETDLYHKAQVVEDGAKGAAIAGLVYAATYSLDTPSSEDIVVEGVPVGSDDSIIADVLDSLGLFG